MKAHIGFALLGLASFAVAAPPTVSASATIGPAHAGKPIAVTVKLTIPTGYHIYGPVVKGSIPTSVAWGGPAGYKLQAKYPATKPYQALGEKVQVYEGSVSIPVTITAPKGTKGKVPLKLKVTTQACNDRACLPPKTAEINTFVVVK